MSKESARNLGFVHLLRLSADHGASVVAVLKRVIYIGRWYGERRNLEVWSKKKRLCAHFVFT